MSFPIMSSLAFRFANTATYVIHIKTLQCSLSTKSCVSKFATEFMNRRT